MSRTVNPPPDYSFFKKREIYCTDSIYIYIVCKRLNYRIVPVINLNRYLQYGLDPEAQSV